MARNFLNTCPDCHVVHECVASDGKCKECQGTGYKGFSQGVAFEIFSPPENQLCETCHGSGICQTCKGKGVLEEDSFFEQSSSYRQEERYIEKSNNDYDTDTITSSNTYSGGYSGGGYYSTDHNNKDSATVLWSILILYFTPGLFTGLAMKDFPGFAKIVPGIFWPILFIFGCIEQGLISTFGFRPTSASACYAAGIKGLIVGGIIVAVLWIFKSSSSSSK